MEERGIRPFIIGLDRIYMTDSGGKLLAEITFQKIQKGLYNISHTYVDKSLRGKGIAAELVKAAVDEIKLRKGTVTATCTYASDWLLRHRVC